MYNKGIEPNNMLYHTIFTSITLMTINIASTIELITINIADIIDLMAINIAYIIYPIFDRILPVLNSIMTINNLTNFIIIIAIIKMYDVVSKINDNIITYNSLLEDISNNVNNEILSLKDDLNAVEFNIKKSLKRRSNI